MHPRDVVRLLRAIEQEQDLAPVRELHRQMEQDEKGWADMRSLAEIVRDREAREKRTREDVDKLIAMGWKPKTATFLAERLESVTVEESEEDDDTEGESTYPLLTDPSPAPATVAKPSPAVASAVFREKIQSLLRKK